MSLDLAQDTPFGGAGALTEGMGPRASWARDISGRALFRFVAQHVASEASQYPRQLEYSGTGNSEIGVFDEDLVVSWGDSDEKVPLIMLQEGNFFRHKSIPLDQVLDQVLWSGRLAVVRYDHAELRL